MFIWLIDHVIANIPSWIWAAVAGAGAAAYFLSNFVPKPYSLIIKLVGVIVLLGSVFMCGGSGVTAILKSQLAELEAKVAVSEQQSKDANTALSNALKDKKNNNKQVQVIIQERIVHDAAKMDATCKVDPVAITDLNDAAANKGTAK